MGAQETLVQINNLYRRFTKKDKQRLPFLVVAMVCGSLMEIFAISSIFPFLAVLTSPERFITDYKWVLELLSLEGASQNHIMIVFALLFVTVTCIASTVRLALYFYSLDTGFKLGVAFNKSLFRAMLRAPYEEQYKLSVSDKTSNATTKSGIIIYNVVLPCINIIAVFVLLIVAMWGLILVLPGSAINAFFLLIITYLIINLLVKYRLQKISENINRATSQVAREIQEAFGLIREVTLYSSYEKYEEQYSKADRELRLAQLNAAFLAAAPKYGLETIALIILAILAVNAQISQNDFLPTLGLAAFAIQRLLPQLQNAYSSYTSIKSSHHVLSEVNAIFEKEESFEKGESPLLQNNSPLLTFQEIVLSDISYKINGTDTFTLKNAHARFTKGNMAAIIGSSGSGKSTLLDIISGLRRPTKGEIYIDQHILMDQNIKSWQNNISYVSQDPFLFSGSILRNIAQTVDGEPIDQNRIKQAARQAQIYDWIESLPDGLSTNISDRGANLSGGQKQRICIARALYRRSSALFLDETLSSLDSLTEENVYNTLERLKHQMIIIVVTHRKSSLNKFDVIYEVKDGLVILYDDKLYDS